MKKLLLLSLFPFLLAGCFQVQKGEDVTVQIRTTNATNRGTPLYVVVKETTMSDFLMDDYHQIATQSFWKEDEDNYLLKKMVVPGRTDKFLIEATDNNSLGIYFIFTNPGECWKYFIDKPASKKVKVLLGKDEYEAINVYGS